MTPQACLKNSCGSKVAGDFVGRVAHHLERFHAREFEGANFVMERGFQSDRVQRQVDRVNFDEVDLEFVGAQTVLAVRGLILEFQPMPAKPGFGGVF